MEVVGMWCICNLTSPDCDFPWLLDPSDLGWSNKTSFAVYGRFVDGLASTLGPLFTTVAQGQGSSDTYFASDVAMALWNSDNVSAQMDYLAESMSIHMRDSSSGGSDVIPGGAFTTEPYFKVTWPWLILPIAVVVSVTVFVVVLMVETREVEDSVVEE